MELAQKALYTSSFIVLLLSIAAGPLQGQTRTPQPSAQQPPPTGFANCDQCGLCQQKGVIQPTPESYEKCKQCLYPNTTDIYDTLKIDPTTKLPPSPYNENMYTILGCLRTDAGEFTVQLSQLFFNIVGGIAFLFLLYGAGLVIASRGNVERLSHGKRVIYAAIVGLIFVFTSTLIIRFIAVDVLKIPGFGG